MSVPQATLTFPSAPPASSTLYREADPIARALLADPRVKRGLVLSVQPPPSHPVAFLTSSFSPPEGPPSPPSRAAPEYAPPQSLFVRSTQRGAIAASLRVDPRVLTLSRAAALSTSPRFKGAQPWHVRAAPSHGEPLDLSAHLIEAPRATSSSTAGTQSDAMRPRPPSPSFDAARCKTGVDAGTQVVHGTRERHKRGTAGPGTEKLWDFDAEVAPLVSNLVESVLEQSLLEHAREEELRRLAARRGLLQSSIDSDSRAAAFAEDAARAAAARARAVVDSARELAASRVSATVKVCAASMSRGAIAAIIRKSLKRARDANDPTLQDISTNFLPRVYTDVAAACDSSNQSMDAIVSGMVRDALLSGAERHAEVHVADTSLQRFSIRALVRLPRTASDVSADAHLPPSFTLEGETHVHVHDEQDAGGHYFRTVTVGPQRVLRSETVREVEAGLQHWLEHAHSRHTRRVLTLAGGAHLGLCLHGRRLPMDDVLLDLSPDDLAHLILHPVRGDHLVPWLHGISEETLPPPWGTGVVAARRDDHDHESHVSEHPLHAFTPMVPHVITPTAHAHAPEEHLVWHPHSDHHKHHASHGHHRDGVSPHSGAASVASEGDHTHVTGVV